MIFLYLLCIESMKENVYKKDDYENEQTTPGTILWQKRVRYFSASLGNFRTSDRQM